MGRPPQELLRARRGPVSPGEGPSKIKCNRKSNTMVPLPKMTSQNKLLVLDTQVCSHKVTVAPTTTFHLDTLNNHGL